MKRLLSAEQAAASRVNGRKSRGPKTAAGKARSRLNAWKGGILAREVVLADRESWDREREGEFRALHRQFREHLEPEGPVESILVERMVTAYWRLHRVLVGERGEITGHLLDAEQLGKPDWLRLSLARDRGDLKSSGDGMMYVAEVLRRARGRVETEGELTNEALTYASACLGEPMQWLITELNEAAKDSSQASEDESEGMAGESPAANPAVDGEAGKAERKARVLAILERELRRCERDLPALQEEERQEEQARLDAAVLPTPEALQKILRYEAMLERQFYRAMNQLERLQRARRGEEVKPPVAVVVSGG
ncbi:MAG TPA: hypothetical protein VMP11_02325 [Verrucomicrobiae bacterium]|nr:hypothetical protein [Verrucomicrobiae bacterium]